jgi:para-nitrobenzyl esterase
LYRSPLYGPWLTGGRAALLIAQQEPMGEDCLVVNVLTPKADKRGRPVMVYLHGGGFTGNSGAINTLGEKLVIEEDVVLVTVNHRLGTLGYLYLGELSDRYAEGNPGLLDLVAALQWVRQNIENFGGDPKKVTIFGDSGGGAKVGLMMAMPQAKGLFRAAIMESSSSPTGIPASDATQTARRLLSQLDIAPADLAKLQNLPFSAFLPKGNGQSPLTVSKPVVDGRTLAGPGWATGAPATAADIPLIIGVCADEETIFSGMQYPDTFQVDWSNAAPRLATLTGKAAADLEPALAAYRQAYPQENAPDIFFRMLSLAGNGLGRTSRIVAEAKAAQAPPVYYYRNEFDTGIPPGVRAFHTSELPLACRMVVDPRAEGLSRQIAGAWAAFARSGDDPNHSGLPQWPRYLPGGGASIMLLNRTSAAGPDPGQKAEDLLRQVFSDLPRA